MVSGFLGQRPGFGILAGGITLVVGFPVDGTTLVVVVVVVGTIQQ